jgi:hypothetical protein
MTELSEERLADLIAALAPVPAGWMTAAIELPAARVAIDELVARALADEGHRRAVLADLELALRQAGVEPRPDVLADVRSRLGAPGL